MRWTERQRQLLGAMGLRLWVPETAADPAEPQDRQAPSAASAPTSTAAAAPLPVAGPAPTPAPMPMPTKSVAETATGPASWGAPDAPRAQAILTLAWEPLQQAVRDCRACELCEGRQQTVFGVGHPNAHWMIVGEAPGEQEDKQGEPFVGAAGHLLDQMLAALHLSRQDGPPERQVFIANAIKCRPPRNRNPAPDEMAHCAPFLARQIALVRPRVILAMGRFAIQQVLGTDEAVGRLRGRVHRHAEVPVVATYHPAYLLRQAADKRKAWEDLCLAAQVVDSPTGTH